jgi:metallo-beta-lactamase family protein
MRLKFFGAAGTVTGSSYLLTSDSGYSILVDYGMFQGTEDDGNSNFNPLATDVSKISGMVLTHAHLDHCGRMPLLLRQGFTKNIWMTPPTKDITEVSLYDTAKINKFGKGKILYDEKEVDKIINLFKTIKYGSKFTIGDFEIVMRDAGHILGSASLEIIDKSVRENFKKIVFSGDLGNTPQDLIKPTELINSADAVIMESTYGDKDHPEGFAADSIQSEINIIEKTGGILLIPSFSIERSQELLHIIYHLKMVRKIKSETPVIMDSPMANKVTQIFEKYREYYNNEFADDFKKDNPFQFAGLESRMANPNGPVVIIAGSGMMTGGKIVQYASRFLPLASTRLLIVGYQGEETLGRTLLEGKKIVKIDGIDVPVGATVNHIETMSSHAGQRQLINWIKNINGVKKVFITHGEDEPREVLSEKITAELGIGDITLPKLNEEFEVK